jgi:CheY-like chemotaxis protein
MDAKKILIIDDDTFLLGIYSVKFQKSGFEVKVAAAGSEAFAILKGGYAPDIILLDLVMPILDGFAVYENIKKENLAPLAVTIMLTNQGLSSDIQRAKELGIQGYIIKATTIPAEVVSEALDIFAKNTK